MSRLSWPVRLAVLAVGALVAASCSTVGLGDESHEQSVPEPTLGTEVADEAGAGGDDAGEAGEETAAVEPSPSIWTRADDAALRPDLPVSDLNDAAAADGNAPWTIVGAEYDYELNRSIPVVWEIDAPQAINSWTREDLGDGPDTDARMSAIDRAATGDIVVGNRGQNVDQRAAIWTRPAGGSWQQVDPEVFAGDVQERLYEVASDPDGEAAIAVGVRVTDLNKRVPSLWIRESTDSGWQVVDGLPFASDGSEDVDGVALGPTSMVLTGTISGANTHDAAAWVSVDGLTWNEADIELPADVNESYLADAVWFDGRFVAVGGVAINSIYVPAAWSSTDGISWALEDRDFEMNDDGRGSTAGVGALLLTVAEDRLLASANISFMQHVWSSDSGSDWRTVDNLWDIKPDGVSIGGLAGDNSDVFIASSEPVVLYHRDGWRRAGIIRQLMPSPSFEPYVNDVVATDDGWVMVGGTSFIKPTGSPADRAEVWHSTDGTIWEEFGRIPMASLGPVVDAHVELDGSGLLSVGWETTASATERRTFGRSIVWDGGGDRWVELTASALEDEDHKISMNAITRAGNDVIAGGLIFAGDNIDAYLVDSSLGLDQSVPIGYDSSDNESISALCSSENGTAVAMVKIDARDGGARVMPLVRSAAGEWSEAELQASGSEPTRMGIFDCVHGPDGFIAAGWSRSGENEDVALLRSSDGSSWERIEGPPTFRTEANQWALSIAATDAGYIVAGNDTSSGQVLPVVWYGSGDEWGQVVIGDDAIDMTSTQIAVSNGTVVAVGRKQGAEQVYTTTVDELVAAAQSGP